MVGNEERRWWLIDEKCCIEEEKKHTERERERECVFPPSPLVLGIFVRQRRGKRREERETKQKVRYGFGPMDLEG